MGQGWQEDVPRPEDEQAGGSEGRAPGKGRGTGAISGNLSPTSEGRFSFPHQRSASGLILPERALDWPQGY